ncbi:MAG TPA: alkaline phosphatase family protein [Streptosporangiaceae bacterium]
MTSEPVTQPTVPNYGEGSLPDLARSVLAALGVNGAANPLALPPSSRVCLLVVDGLGWELLREHPAAAPFLSELAITGRALMAGFPATTVTSLSSLGTGLAPGEHGMLGYQVAVPGAGRLLNGLRWDERVDPLSWQPSPSIYQQAEAAGVAAYRVAARALEKTGFSVAAMRGASYRSADSMGALVAQALAALASADRCLVTVYHADLDGTGHVFGSRSDAWFYQLAHVDKLAEQLAGALPPGTTMYVTADHGMVDSAPEERIDVDELAVLRDGVALLGGEPRARHVYAEPGAAADVLISWQETLGPRAWVVTRDEAIEAGWFGPVDRRFAGRIGDVVAAPAGSWAIVASQAERLESSLIGMHGSLTPGDQFVPLLSVSSR